MKTIQIGSLWPELPKDKMRFDLNLPAYFRTIAGNPRYSHEDIGRIVRCIVFDSEAFVTPLIEIDVRNLIQHQKTKEKTRKKVARFRARKAGDESEENKIRPVGRPRGVPDGMPAALIAMKKKIGQKSAEENEPDANERAFGVWKRIQDPVDVGRFSARSSETGKKRDENMPGPIPSVEDAQYIERAPRNSYQGAGYSDEDLIRKMARYSSSQKKKKVG